MKARILARDHRRARHPVAVGEGACPLPFPCGSPAQATPPSSEASLSPVDVHDTHHAQIIVKVLSTCS
jgi:hypothetical protein